MQHRNITSSSFFKNSTSELFLKKYGVTSCPKEFGKIREHACMLASTCLGIQAFDVRSIIFCLAVATRFKMKQRRDTLSYYFLQF
jgi:hypothetical protein